MSQRRLEALAAPSATGNIVAGIVGSTEFIPAVNYFEGYPAASLLAPEARAFIYLLIRSMRLQHALEIGTYFAGTTEVMARALWANGGGRLDTVDPSSPQAVATTLKSWDPRLSELCSYHCMNSMQFFGAAVLEARKYDFVFVDGDHDYEPALFDLQCSAKLLEPGGFMLIDDVNLPSVRAAAVAFLGQAPGFMLLGDHPEQMLGHPAIMPGGLMSVERTNFWCLRAPSLIALADRLVTFPNAAFNGDEICGFCLELPEAGADDLHGTLLYRLYLRMLPTLGGVGLMPQQLEAVGETRLLSGRPTVAVRFAQPLTLRQFPRRNEHYSLVEINLTYMPDPSCPDRLEIRGRPELLTS